MDSMHHSRKVSTGLAEGLFVTLEGLDGSGKTSAMKPLAGWLLGMGFEVVSVKEPGGTSLGEAVRTIFFQHHDSACPEAELGLLLTCKAQLLHTTILPALQRGAIVLCDRYTDTLFAYQHYGKGHDALLMQKMLEAFNCEHMPDYTLYFDVCPSTSMRRGLDRKEQGGEHNSLDRAGLEFRHDVANGFFTRLRERPDQTSWKQLDAEQELVHVFLEAQHALKEKLVAIGAASETEFDLPPVVNPLALL